MIIMLERKEVNENVSYIIVIIIMLWKKEERENISYTIIIIIILQKKEEKEKCRSRATVPPHRPRTRLLNTQISTKDISRRSRHYLMVRQVQGIIKRESFFLVLPLSLFLYSVFHIGGLVILDLPQWTPDSLYKSFHNKLGFSDILQTYPCPSSKN